MLTAVKLNKNPGPGAHNAHQKEVIVGEHKTMGLPELMKPLTDNGVPAPNTYTIEHQDRIPSFKLKPVTELNEKQ
jgi:hypothetical protein